MGELDVRILMELFGGREVAVALAPAWNGGIYYAAQRKTAVTVAEKESTASIGLLYASRWKNPDSARTFVRVYAGQLGRKYQHLTRRPKDEANDGEQVYSTEEGDVLISMSGSSVFVSEGFAAPLARKLRDSIESVQSEGPLRMAGLPSGVRQNSMGSHELSMEVVHGIAGFGAMKAAVPAAIYSQGHLVAIH